MIENLQLIKRNDTVDLMLRIFLRSRQISNETNIETFKIFLMNKGNRINESDYYNFFENLEGFGFGHFKDDYTFIWKYSLHKVAEQILYPNRLVKLEPEMDTDLEVEKETTKIMPRPKGSKNKPKETNEESQIHINEIKEAPLELKDTPQVKKRGRPAGWKKEIQQPYGVRPGLKTGIIFVFTTSDNRTIPLNLDDADKLVRQVEEVKKMNL